MSTHLSYWSSTYHVDLPLQSLKLLSVDVQATGASPAVGSIIELAYHPYSLQKITTPIQPNDCDSIFSQSTLVMTPPGTHLSRRVSHLTGIRKSMLKSAMQPIDVAYQLWQTIEEINSRIDQGEPWVWVAHVARYERSFIRALCFAHLPPKRSKKEAELLFNHIPWLCTHAISIRLYPTLPRRTLSAMNSIFGGDQIHLKRTSAHLKATKVIWKGLLKELEKHSISVWGDLCDLIKKPAKRLPFSPPLPAKKRLSAPTLPGVYTFYDERGEPIYVGKARNLNQRVNQHFRGKRGHDERHLELLTVTKDVSWEITRSTLEAQHLENKKIKGLKPKYNRALTSTSAPFYLNSQEWTQHVASETDYQDDILGPWIDQGIFNAIKVFRAAQKGDFSWIHANSWPQMDVSDWKCATAKVEKILDNFESAPKHIQELFPYSWHNDSIPAWLGLGHQLSHSNRELDSDDPLEERAKRLALTLWETWQAAQWQSVLSSGTMIWSADEGGDYKITRSLPLDFYSEQESTYVSTLPKIQSVLSDLNDLNSFVKHSHTLRLHFDQSRLTYLTVARHMREGLPVYYSCEEEPQIWYEILFNPPIKSEQSWIDDL